MPLEFHHREKLPKLFKAFLRLGLTTFGGPAMVAYIQDLAVKKNKWLTEESFKHGVAVCQSIPCVTAMQVAAYVGLRAGGGYASVPIMLHEVVGARHWMDSKVFMDGIALGQITPGPIVITATFVGYLIAGLPGALVGAVVSALIL